MKRAAPILIALLIAACGGSRDDAGTMKEGQGMMSADSAQMREMGGTGEMTDPDSGMGGMGGMADPDSSMGSMADPDTGMVAGTAGMAGR